MKITDVRAVQPIAVNSPPDWRTSLGQILVAIDTDVGLTGYGVGGGGQAGIHVVRTVLRDLLLGRDPEPVEQRWQAQYDATLPFGRKGLAIMALSGVDLALWDLRGKAARQSVAQLLGGVQHSRIPTYCTVWDDVPSEVVGQFRAFKLHVGHQRPGAKVAGSLSDPVKASAAASNPNRFSPAAESPDYSGSLHDPVAGTVAAIARARAAIGKDCPLMIDAWMKWDLATTLAVARAAEPYRLDWIEEPLPVDDLAGYITLGQDCPVPIAGGEHEFTARGFAEIIERGLHRVLQPDVCWCGGMTELVKIYRLAREANLRVCPHRGAEVWGLHALAALDPDPLAETGRPWMGWVGGQPEIVDGFIEVGTAPGFGTVVDEARLPIR